MVPFTKVNEVVGRGEISRKLKDSQSRKEKGPGRGKGGKSEIRGNSGQIICLYYVHVCICNRPQHLVQLYCTNKKYGKEVNG